ncbi:hypothetical protein NSS79_06770 [Paenibacillus sp. FSL L8-0436]|uniref:hypothetical protein n=1 Tax=Paenibacillus sp. FSL L8-0436 TaxID=2954686 RepID=UPI00315947AB
MMGKSHLVISTGVTLSVMNLLADSLTQRGITPLPPIPFKLRLKLMSTGTKKGDAVENLCIVFTLVLVIYAFVLTP